MTWDWDLVFSLLISSRILRGVWTTIWIAVVAQTGGTVIGMICAQMQLSRFFPLRLVAGLYDWVFRGTPMLVQILFAYAALPLVLPSLRLGAIQSGILALVLNEGARMSQVCRAGLLSISEGQLESAKSLGMSGWQTFRLVIFPQAFRLIIPPLGNNFNNLLKATSLLAVIGFGELLRVSQEIANLTARPLEAYFVASLYYLLMLTIWGRVQAALENRFAIPGA